MSAMGATKTVLRGFGYLVFFVLCVAFFVWLTFPEDKVREFVEYKASDALGSTVTIGELALMGLGGVELTDVNIRLESLEDPREQAAAGGAEGKDAKDAKNGKDAKAGKDGKDARDAKAKKPRKKPRIIMASRVAADLSLMAFLGGAIEGTFELDVQGGEIRGGVVDMKPDQPAHLEIDSIEGVMLGPEKLFLGLIGFDLRAVIANGSISIDLGKEISSLEGSVDLTLAQARIKAPKIPTKQFGPIMLSDIDLGTLTLSVRAGRKGDMPKWKRLRGRMAEDRVIHFAEVSGDGEDVQILGDDVSTITLPAGKPLKDAKLNLHFAVHITDAFLDKKVEDEDGGTSQPNKILKMAMKQDAKLRRSIKDGVLGIKCTGTFGKPDCGIERTKLRMSNFKVRKPKFQSDSNEEGEDKPEAKAPSTSRPRKAKTERPSTARKTRTPARTSASERARSARNRTATPRTNPRTAPAGPATPGRDVTSRLPRTPARSPARPLPTIAPTPGDSAYEAPGEEEPEEEGGEEEPLEIEEEPLEEGEEPLEEGEEPLEEGEEPLEEGEEGGEELPLEEGEEEAPQE